MLYQAALLGATYLSTQSVILPSLRPSHPNQGPWADSLRAPRLFPTISFCPLPSF